MKKIFKYSFLAILLLTADVSVAEIINVKYRNRPLDTEKGNFIEPNLKSSSLVKRILYDEPSKYLVVKLQKTYYHYCGMPSSQVQSWIASQSLGSHYIAMIKGNFDCRILPMPEY